MKSSANLQSSPLIASSADLPFQALINDKPFFAKSVISRSCWRSELQHKPIRRIWKILATGHLGRHGTSLGLFIDQTLEPGTYNLVDNPKISIVYHMTPRLFARVYHSRHFQAGRLTLLECNVETRRLIGTFEFSMPAVEFKVTHGAFNLQWIDEAPAVSAQ